MLRVVANKLRLLFDDDGIYWASEPVDSLTVQQMRKILWPTAVAEASWAFTSTMMLQHWGAVKNAFGFESTASSSPASPSEALAQPRISSAGRQTADGMPSIGAVDTASNTNDQQPSEETGSGGRTNFLKENIASSVVGLRQMSSGPWMTFRKKLAQKWKPTKDYPPRGSIMVSGMIELETPRAFIVIDVRSFYDPETRKFPVKSMFLNVRRIQMKVQKPARG